jgi:uncharacterized protein YbcC (UPF0753/DUF2309 family)
MANKIQNIPAKAKELLEVVTEEFGMEVIEKYIKLYKKRQRKTMKHHNTKEGVAYDVYKLMFEEKYDRTKAINEISIKRNITISTINNHLNSFNQEAKKKNFYTLGWIVDKIYDTYNNNQYINDNSDFDINLLATENNSEKEILETYYYKYKTLIKREKDKFEIDIKSIKIPDAIKNIFPEYFSKNEDTSNTTTDLYSDEDDIPF